MMQTTEILNLNHPNAIPQAVKTINAGGVIAFPTDTVYGIGANAFDEKALEKIYQVKDRSLLKAIPVLIGSKKDLDKISPPLDLDVIKVITRFWPGALTLILPLLPELPGLLSPTPTVGLRIPDHDPVRELLMRTGPLAVTSANISGQPPALNAEEVFQNLAGRIDLILDGGSAPGGRASTVLDLSDERPKVLREGPISLDQIMEVILAKD